MTEVDPSARVQVRGLATLLAPATCAMCGNGTRDRYVDPAIFYEYEGQVYFCVPCTEEIASTIGCLSTDESRLLLEINAELLAKNAELEIKAHHYDELTNVLRNSGISVPDPSPVAVVSVVPDKASDERNRESRITDDKPTVKRTPVRAVVTKSDEGSGRSDATRSDGSDEPTAHANKLNI